VYDGDGNRIFKTENGVTTLYLGGVYEEGYNPSSTELALQETLEVPFARGAEDNETAQSYKRYFKT